MLESRLGPRTLDMARELLAAVAACCRPGAPLLLESDEHRPYRQAMLDLFGKTRFRRRKRGHGRLKYPDSKPAPGLMIGTVHKVRNAARRVVRVRPMRFCGRLKDIRRCLKRHRAGCQINTSHVERINGTLRTQQARLVRRTRSGTLQADQLQAGIWLWRDLYNWTRRHGSLDTCTPAMALGVTDRVWSVQEYVRRPVHVAPFQRCCWQEQHKQLVTTGLYDQKHRKLLPVS